MLYSVLSGVLSDLVRLTRRETVRTLGILFDTVLYYSGVLSDLARLTSREAVRTLGTLSRSNLFKSGVQTSSANLKPRSYFVNNKISKATISHQDEYFTKSFLLNYHFIFVFTKNLITKLISITYPNNKLISYTYILDYNVDLLQVLD